MRSNFDKFATGFSIIITPSAIDGAPSGLSDMDDSSFNFLWTMNPFRLNIQTLLTDFILGFHTLIIHVPAFTGVHSLPVGLSVVARRYLDQTLLHGM